jgi:hypothetical protein
VTAEIFIKPENPCPFCGKNEATQLCDFVVDYIWTSMMGAQHETCDNAMCTDCATKATAYEFCPTCAKLYEYVRKNHKRKIKFTRRDAK